MSPDSVETATAILRHIGVRFSWRISRSAGMKERLLETPSSNLRHPANPRTQKFWHDVFLFGARFSLARQKREIGGL